MTPPHCSQPPDPRTDPCRWPRAEVAKAHDHFCQPDPQSHRQYAQHTGIPLPPPSTTGLAVDQAALADPELHPDLVAFLQCPAGDEMAPFFGPGGVGVSVTPIAQADDALVWSA